MNKNTKVNTPNYRNIIAGAVATMFEWYDYAVYGYFAVIIGKNFFPNTNRFIEVMSAFAVFATGFIMRPLGAILFGFIGDKLGRKKALALSVIMMAIPTTILGLLPTYQHWGVTASILLVSIRLIQGLAVGGNYGGSFVFAVEHAKPNQKGFAGSLVMVGVIVGILLGSAIAALLSYHLNDTQLETWGWRIPFLLGLIAIFSGFYIKEYTSETPIFESIQAEVSKKNQYPLRTLFTNHKSSIFQAIGFVLFDVVGIYIFFFYMTTFLTTHISMPLSVVLKMNTVNLLCMVLCIPFFGKLADKFGCKKIMYSISFAFILLSYPAFVVFTSGHILYCWLMQAIFAIIMAAVYGVLPIVVVELFPTQVRYSASSLVCNIAAAIFGGTAPWLCAWIIYKTGLKIAPAFYLISIGIIGCIATLYASKKINYQQKL